MVEWGVSGLHRELHTAMDNLPRLSFPFLSFFIDAIYSPEYHMFSR